ncbi:MAG: DUF5058 family protein [Oscillospiraceae bacterium]|jgi:hypothetical protein|nr:DUF5058 family protein [Oscillospiraceae bacterium]
MNYIDASGHWITYVAAAAGIIYVAALTGVVMRKSWRRALKIGFTRQQLMKIVRISVPHTLVPAVAVLVGFFTLAPVLGIPLSWLRLSVIGNTTYEIMAANTALASAGVTDTGSASGREFILIMYVMALGIMGGLVIAPLLSRRIHRGIFKTRAADRRWSALNVSTYMMAIAAAFTVPVFFRFSVSLMTLLTGAAAALSLSALRRRFSVAWLDDLEYTIGVLIAMFSSILWTRLFA